MALLANCCTCLGDFQQAAVLCTQSRQLLKVCGLEGGATDLVAQNYEAEIHLLKTEYLEARPANAYVASSRPHGHLPTFQTAFAYVNLALIDIATGAEPDLIHRNADIARDQFSTSLAYPIGVPLCTVVYAEMHLREGNPSLARPLFEQSFLAMRDKLDEGAVMCLEQLADVGNAMNDVDATLRWAGVFLASALKARNRLATMKAIRCLGDIFAAKDDVETALQLLEVALDGFTRMDVHRCRAECMVRISRILEKRGEADRAIHLLKEAKLLFERSSQVKEVDRVDSKLELFNCSGRLGKGSVASEHLD
jgi:tetratricopeptide (TPR) repeat protein